MQAKLNYFSEPVQKHKKISERKEQTSLYFFYEAKKRHTFGRIAEAKYVYQRVLKFNPYCDASYYELGNIAIAEENFQEAIKLFLSAYFLDSTNYWYSNNLAKLFAITSQPQKAEIFYKITLRQNPKQKTAYQELLLIYEALQKNEKAISLIKLYLQHYSADESILLILQNLLFRQGRITEAINTVKLLLEKNQFEQSYYLLLAKLYGESRKDSLSFLEIEKAKKIDSLSINYLVELSDYYRRTVNFQNYFNTLLRLFENPKTNLELKTNYFSFLSQFPPLLKQYIPQVDSLYNNARKSFSYQTEMFCATYLLQTNRVQQAKHILKSLTSRGLQDAYLFDVSKNKRKSKFFKAYAQELSAYYDAWLIFFDIILNQQNWRELIAEVNNFEEMFPESVQYSFLKGLAYFQLKDFQSAINYWQESEKIMSKKDSSFCLRIYSSLGDAYEANKQHVKAEIYFEKALKLNPREFLVLNNYAYYLSLRKKNLSKALKMSKMVVNEYPQNAVYLDTYAWILYQMKDYAKAKEYLQKAMANGGAEETTLLEHYGDVLAALNENIAHIYWERAVEKGANSPELLEKIKKFKK
ncbi:MAG: tetratricopeptide repeat protein [Bacteroidales bacterium]